MKQIKLLAIALILATATYAQNGDKQIKQSAEEIAKKKSEKMATQLDLSAEQKEKVYQLTLTKINTIKTAKKSYRKSIKSILTPEQIAVQKEKRGAKKKKSTHKGHNHKGHNHQGHQH